ncbi:MAG: thioredoxin domain-containing protein [Balneolaceae bacterium]
MSNKLASEKSPYLQQHQENPVEWFPWGKEAFEKAHQENKPVFLSIGYATCHWCHVMAHESFEDPAIADLMNEAFINIKVDREERPDIDSTYMTVCQMLTGQGGWPLTIIMTPEKEPFFAATYIPKEARFNRIGLRQLIPGIAGMWNNERERINKATTQIKEGFSQSQQYEKGNFPGTEAIDFAAEQLTKRFDAEHGGFGNAPKFPSPHNLMFLLRQWKSTGKDRFLGVVSETLQAMRLGGIWDHIGFGFHRYSTDEKWLLPHFEKMLYDQALLMIAYTETWQATKNPLFKQTAYEISEYVLGDLHHSDGAFYSAEDADSEGEEGKFYIWGKEEIQEILSADDEKKFSELFNIISDGNFKDEASGELTGKNIPHLNAALGNKDVDWFNDIRKKLFEKREKRVRPALDDKILTDWNSLMIAAFAKAGFAFSDDELLEVAETAYNFLERNAIKDGRLTHRYKDGEAAIDAMADDYAFFVWALIELYQSTFKPEYLEKAISWNRKFIDLFWDEENGAFYFSINDEDQVFGRQKQIYDGAIPSANSVAMLNQIRLSRLTGDTELEDYANKTGQLFSADLIRSGASITYGMQSIQFLNNASKEVSLIGEKDELQEILNLIGKQFVPFVTTHILDSSSREQVQKLAVYTSTQKRVDNKPTYYLCENFTCEKPVSGIEAIKKSLNG